MVGMKSVIEEASVEEGSIVAAGAIVTPGTVVPTGQVTDKFHQQCMQACCPVYPSLVGGAACFLTYMLCIHPQQARDG